MEPYQFYAVLASSITLISGGIGWIVSMIKSNEKRIRDLELHVAVLEAIMKERKS